MYKWFEKYFAFSRRELHGICLLGVFLLALWSAPRIDRSSDNNVEMAVQIADIERFIATADKRNSSAGTKKPAFKHPEAYIAEVEYFRFDPNGLAVVDWRRLGLSERQIRMIKNYEAKGGRFRKKEDLKKIYAISEADYARLAAYIQIEVADSPGPAPDRPSERSDRPVVEPGESQTVYLDLNVADSLELQILPGIGPVFASRIVRFRDLLGGFHHISQLMDVYGFDSLRFDGLKTDVYVDTGKVKKIPVNTADYDRLRSHPFINPKLANAIVQYRKQHGPYQSLTDLLDIVIMDKEIFRKIAPYLTISND